MVLSDGLAERANYMSRSEELASLSSDVFKLYDIRGKLSSDFVKSLGNKIASKYGSVVVMTDTKESSKELSKLFSDGVNEAGFDVTYCGVGPTDMCSLAGAHFKMVSVMFTASHLSDNQDGIKFHDSKGLPFSSDMIAGIKSLNASGKKVKKGVTKDFDFLEIYSTKALVRYNELFNHDLRGLRVLIDVKNGCALSPLLLKRLGANVDVVNTKGSDPSNNSELKSKARDYDLVLVHDFDADRVLLISESGIVNGSLIACLLTDVFKGDVVAGFDTSQVLTNYAKVIYTKVGDPFVARGVLESNACLGVEFSGHFTDPCFALTSSGSYFALILAGLALKKGINERLNELPHVEIIIDKLIVDDKDAFMKRVISKINPKDVISKIDGVKFYFNDCVALIRPGGTEPIIRFYLDNPVKGCSINDLMRFFK